MNLTKESCYEMEIAVSKLLDSKSMATMKLHLQTFFMRRWNGMFCPNFNEMRNRNAIRHSTLMLLGLNENEDPYSSKNSMNFVDDMTKWPPVEYGHIFCYFIHRPGVYTRRQLLQWKSLESYNYFKQGWTIFRYQ